MQFSRIPAELRSSRSQRPLAHQAEGHESLRQISTRQQPQTPCLRCPCQWQTAWGLRRTWRTTWPLWRRRRRKTARTIRAWLTQPLWWRTWWRREDLWPLKLPPLSLLSRLRWLLLPQYLRWILPWQSRLLSRQKEGGEGKGGGGKAGIQLPPECQDQHQPPLLPLKCPDQLQPPVLLRECPNLLPPPISHLQMRRRQAAGQEDTKYILIILWFESFTMMNLIMMIWWICDELMMKILWKIWMMMNFVSQWMN